MMNTKDLLLVLLLAPSLLVLGELDVLESKEYKETNQRKSLRLNKFDFAERKVGAETYNELKPAYTGKINSFPDQTRVQQGKFIGRIPEPSSEFEISFDLTLGRNQGDRKSWKSILHFTDPTMSWRGWTGKHSPGYFYPSFFLSNNKNDESHNQHRLFLNLISEKKNMHILYSRRKLDLNKTYRIRVLALRDFVDLFIDEVNEGRVYMPLNVRPIPENLDVVSKLKYPGRPDQFKDGEAKIENLKYTAYLWKNTTKSCEGGGVTFTKCRTNHRYGGDSTHRDCLDEAQAMNAKGVESYNKNKKHFCDFYFEPKDGLCMAKKLAGFMGKDQKGKAASGPIKPSQITAAESGGLCFYNPYFFD